MVVPKFDFATTMCITGSPDEDDDDDDEDEDDEDDEVVEPEDDEDDDDDEEDDEDDEDDDEESPLELADELADELPEPSQVSSGFGEVLSSKQPAKSTVNVAIGTTRVTMMRETIKPLLQGKLPRFIID